MRELDLIYAGVNPRMVRALEGFRDSCRLYAEVYKKKVYRTWSLGEGEDAVVFLPGGMAHGEVWFPQMLALRGAFRSVAFSLPECKSLQEAAEGILYTLERMEARRIVPVGYSLGGLIAQIMMRIAPERVAGAGLCLTGAPSRELPEDAVAKWSLRRKSAWRMRLINFSTGGRMSMADNAFRGNCPPGQEEQLDFWRAFIEDSYCNHMYQKQFVNLNYIAQPELYAKKPFAPGDMAGWKGEVSILYSEGDKIYADEQPYLRALYPGAKPVDLGGDGQFAMLSHPEETNGEIEELARRSFSV